MKNIFKTVWSCWNKTDRIMAVISTIVFILIICLLFTGCNAQPSHGIIPTPEQYQVNPDEDILDNYIPIYADGVVDFIYCTQDGEYIIEYNDDDYFDMDNLPQPVNCANGDSVVCIYCSEAYFFEYLKWYSSLTNKDTAFFEANNTFYIKEEWCGDTDDPYGYWYYKLVKK